MVPLHRLAPAWVSSSAHLYLSFAQHTTPANSQPFRVSLCKELWWILTPEVLWRSPRLAWIPGQRFPLTMLFATSTPWAATSTMPPRPSTDFVPDAALAVVVDYVAADYHRVCEPVAPDPVPVVVVDLIVP